MEELLNKINKLGYREAESNGLARASIVHIRKDRECFRCGKTIKSGSKAVSASHMMDKLYGVTLANLLNNDFADTDKFKFVPVRHWVCECCAKEVVDRQLSNRKFRHRTVRKNSVNRLEELYKNGEITAKEWDDIEMAEIEQYAFEEAVGIGQY